MEDMSACQQLLGALHRRVREQNDAVAILGQVFVQEAERLRRHDEAYCLDELGRRVTQEAKELRRMEGSASYGFAKTKRDTAVANFILGSLIAAFVGTKQHPLLVGAKLAASERLRSAPFGNLVVAIGPGGIPDDVHVIPLSRLAREQGRAESQVLAALKDSGYQLMTPEVFSTVIDELKEKVLKGVLALPTAGASLVLKPADGSSEWIPYIRGKNAG
jgi:hypothetical protein